MVRPPKPNEPLEESGDRDWPVPSFEFIVEAINEGILLCELDGRLLYVNERMAEMLGYRREQMKDAMLFEFMSEPWAERARQNLARRARGVAEVFEHEFQHRNGTSIQTLVASRPIRVTEQQDYQASLVAITDISERARAIEQLRLSEESFRTVSENSPEGIVIHRDGAIIYANPAMAELLGYDEPAALAGLAIQELVPCDEWPALRERLAGLEANEATSITPYREHHLQRKDGERVTVETAHFEGVYHGQPAVISLLRDITRRKELQAKTMQLDRLLVAGTLAAGVGHEVNNPLAFLSGHLDLAYNAVDDSLAMLRDAQDDGLDDELRRRSRQEAIASLEEVHHSLRAANRGANRIRKIIEDLRVFTREEHGPPYAFDARVVLDTAIQMASHQLPEYARLVRDYERVPAVLGFESALGQVLLNVLVNAAQAIAQAGPDGDHMLRAALRRRDEHVVIEITDTGVGIGDQDLERIFDPFFTTKDPDIGTGLGLSISKKLIERMDGDISASPRPGGGARFRIWLHAAADDG